MSPFMLNTFCRGPFSPTPYCPLTPYAMWLLIRGAISTTLLPYITDADVPLEEGGRASRERERREGGGGKRRRRRKYRPKQNKNTAAAAAVGTSSAGSCGPAHCLFDCDGEQLCIEQCVCVCVCVSFGFLDHIDIKLFKYIVLFKETRKKERRKYLIFMACYF